MVQRVLCSTPHSCMCIVCISKTGLVPVSQPGIIFLCYHRAKSNLKTDNGEKLESIFTPSSCGTLLIHFVNMIFILGGRSASCTDRSAAFVETHHKTQATFRPTASDHTISHGYINLYVDVYIKLKYEPNLFWML